jgi:hypothetical protein
VADEKVDTGAAVEQAQAALEAAQAADAAAKANELENRTQEELILAWMEAVTLRLGNRPELRAVTQKLAAKAAPPPAPAKE